MLMKRMRPAHPLPNPKAFGLPARLRHARNQTGRRELTENEARNLKATNEGATATTHRAAVHDAGRARIARQLREPGVIFVRLQLGAEGSILLHGGALAVVAVNPGGLRHKKERGN